MFSTVIQNINKPHALDDIVTQGNNKRSKVCDADGNGNVNPNCKR